MIDTSPALRAIASPSPAAARDGDDALHERPWLIDANSTRALARNAFARGLAVTKADGTTTPIAITATPMVIDEGELRRRQRVAAHLSAAGLKMSRAALRDAALSPLILGGLSPLEARVATKTFNELTTLVTTRVDFFGSGAALRALEVNATIPAMQGYSDIAAETLLDVVGRAAAVSNATIADWKERNGSNARALYDALLAGYGRVRPRGTPSRIALLCRRNDAQLTELLFLRDRFRSFGTDADVIHPDQIADDDNEVRVAGKAYDLVYRHLFIRRLEEPGMIGAEAVARLLQEVNGRRAVVLNPPASQVEMKSVFALLSQALDDAALATAAALDEGELAAIHGAVPWTRMFRGAQLVADVVDQPERFVLKRAWDYGGRAVFIGHARETASFRERVASAWPDETPEGWRAVCERAAVDARGGGFVVQERVDATPEPHVVAHLDHAEATKLFVDFSAYASVGLGVGLGVVLGTGIEPRWGGVCRGSPSSIVNIMGGGGVVPTITAEVAREVTRALEVARGTAGA